MAKTDESIKSLFACFAASIEVTIPARRAYHLHELSQASQHGCNLRHRRPMSQEPLIGVAAENFLESSLGLNTAILTQILEAGQRARETCTALDPTNFSGISAWAAAVRRSRELLIPLEWKLLNEQNLPLVTNAERHIALAIMTGDERTGRLGVGPPTTRYAKGLVTRSRVKRNFKQLSLLSGQEGESQDNPQFVRWILLVNADGSTLHAELSLPMHVTDDGFVDRWAHRNVLPELDFAGGDEPPPNTPEQINVPVSPR